MTDSTLYFEADPIPYVAIQNKGRGLILTSGGAGEFEFPITGIIEGESDGQICGTPNSIGVLDDFASVQVGNEVEEIDVTFINTGVVVNETVDILRQGLTPLRTLLLSEVFGREIAGGKTIYAIELATDCSEVIYLGVASKARLKEEIIFRGWNRVLPGSNRVRHIVSGLEFRILLYTKGAGRFNIYSMTAWMKLTDRRGFNTSPRSVQQT